MALLWYATLAVLCFSAQGKPATRDLAFDAFLAKEEVVYFRQQSVVYSGVLQTFLGRFETTLPQYANSIITKLQGLNIDVATIDQLFTTISQRITQGAQSIDDELQRVTPTSSGIITSLESSDWVSLGVQNSDLISQLDFINVTYDNTYVQWLSDKQTQENNLNAALAGQTAENIASVIIDWESIKTFISTEGFVVADEQQIFKVRGQKSLDAVKIVLDQV